MVIDTALPLEVRLARPGWLASKVTERLLLAPVLLSSAPQEMLRLAAAVVATPARSPGRELPGLPPLRPSSSTDWVATAAVTGESSLTTTVKVPGAVSPSESLAVKAKVRLRLSSVLAIGWSRLSTRVKL